MASPFFVFLLVVLNWIVGWNIYDVTLMPRLLVLLVILAVSVLALTFSKTSKKIDLPALRDPVILFFGAYALLTAVSLVFATNLTAGFTDTFRTFATLLVLVLSCLLLPTMPNWQVRLPRIVTVAALGACMVGFYQLLSVSGLKFPSRNEAEHVTGLMSNVNLFAGFVSLLLPFCVCGIFLQRGSWRNANIVAAVATVLLVLLLQSRASYLAIASGAVVVLAGLGFFRKSFGVTVPWRAIGAGVGVAFVLAAVFVLVSSNPIALRVRSLLSGDASAIDGGRLMIWGITLEMIRDHFLTGVGAGNFTIRMHEYLGRPELDFSGRSTNWAQPHNDFLWVFVEKGILGFLAFVGALATAVARGVRVLRSNPRRETAWVVLAALASLASYTCSSCLDFPLERINQQVYLAVLLAVLVVSSRPKPAAQSKKISVPGIPAAAVVAVLILGMAYSITAIRQEYLVNLARAGLRIGNYSGAAEYARRAGTPWKTLDPVATPVAYLEGYARLLLGDLNSAIPLLEQARRHNPNRLYILQTLSDAYLAAGRPEDAMNCMELALSRYPGSIAETASSGPRKGQRRFVIPNSKLIVQSDLVRGIEEVRMEGDAVSFNSPGNDPYFHLPTIPPLNRGATVVADITLPAATMVQLYYQTSANPNFSEENSVKKVLPAGRHVIEWPIRAPLLGVFRLDPGNRPGDYKIHAMEFFPAFFSDAPRSLPFDLASDDLLADIHPSNGIENIRRQPGIIGFTATNNDPHFQLPPVPPMPTGATVAIDFTLPAERLVQLFYQTSGEPDFTEEKSVAKPLPAGRHRVEWPIAAPLNGIFRFDPGNGPGDYEIHKVEFLPPAPPRPTTAIGPFVYAKNSLLAESRLVRGIERIRPSLDGLVFTATDNDPYFQLPPAPAMPKGATFAIELTLPADRLVQLYFQTSDEPQFTEKNSVTKALPAGRHLIEWPLDASLNGVFRFDPGNGPGDYRIHKVEVRP